MNDAENWKPNEKRIRSLVAKLPHLCTYSTKAPGVGMAVIYAGLCVPSDKLYVGKYEHGVRGRPVTKRWKVHESGKGGAPLVERAIAKYGKNSFEWFVIDHVSKDIVGEKEKYWIKELDCMSTSGGYNLHEGGLGGNLTEEHRKNIKKALNSPIVKNKILATNRTDATKQRRREGRYDVFFSRPGFAKQNLEILRSDERKEIMSKASKKNWKDAEYRAKVQKGRSNMPDTTKQRIAAGASKRRADPMLEVSRIQKFTNTCNAKYEAEYKRALASKILDWPAKGQPKLPKPQYYRRDGKIGFCEGRVNRFVSIEPEDRNAKKIRNNVKNRARRAKGKACV